MSLNNQPSAHNLVISEQAGTLYLVNPASLQPHPDNYNLHPPEQIAELKASLQEFGQPKNVVIWRGHILAGHGLVTAALEAGLSQIEARDVSDWPPEKAVAFLVADNETARMGQPDYARLQGLVSQAKAAGVSVPGVDAGRLEEIAREARGIKRPGPTEDLPDEDPGDISGLLAPFPWFGGKSRVTGRIWKRFGQVQNYVEPFCGSAAVLLACPYELPIVTLNDMDGFVANFWRAAAYAPDEVAKWVDWPVNENDLFARHVWLIKQAGDLVKKLEADPDYYDAKIAGWWCWGACAWIGTGWCSGEGPWTVEDGEIIGDQGQGVNRKLPELWGRGVHRRALGEGYEGGTRETISAHLRDYMAALSDALRRPRVTCGDWQRVTTPSVTFRHGLTAILLDPPYGEGEQEYSAGGNQDKEIAANVWEWAIENGNNPELRIAVCGYDDGRATPPGWSAMRWKARKGYQVEDTNPSREMVWFSPFCAEVGDDRLP